MTGNERAEELGDGALPADPDISIQPPDESAPESDDPKKPEGDADTTEEGALSPGSTATGSPTSLGE